jgi:GNAT superfamily N-acetyltransferase
MTPDTIDDNRATDRPAQTEDAERIALLCHQLGYPTSREEVARRLRQILQKEHHALYVAEPSDGRVVGWVHVYVRPLVVAELQAEIGGLVVEQSYHRYGIGRLLMLQAEAWARGQGCRTVLLRSSVIRKGAHAFYERIGYDNIKTSLTFRKIL